MSIKPDRKRLDQRCVELGLAPSRQRAQALILAGEIYVNGSPAAKAGDRVAASADIRHQGDGLAYVSRGGVKLAGALDQFGIDAKGQTALDIGASSGGFTDCLLQRGAAHVFAIDVGYGQLAWKLRCDARVTVMERTNIRKVDVDQWRKDTQERNLWPATMAAIDVSFISLRLVLPKVAALVAPGSTLLALVKPQFEAGRDQVGKGGVVRTESVRQRVISDISHWATEHDLCLRAGADALIRGPKGNLEHWLFLETRRANGEGAGSATRGEPAPR